MKIAFLNLCHCDPKVVARVAARLTAHADFDMYIHIDAKTDPRPFVERLKDMQQVFILEDPEKVYWGGYHAIRATYKLLRKALQSERSYDYFILLQNLDYPIKSNEEILAFFEQNPETEYIRGCRISYSKDWQFSKKYKLYNQRDDDFYLQEHTVLGKYLHYLKLLAYSVTTIGSNGTIRESDGIYDLYYGAAQWAVTRKCAEYFDRFEQTHEKYNQRMQHLQFPDEEYFHTIVHNSEFKVRCVKSDEPVQRWLVNWRNLHYFEFPRSVTVLTEKDFPKISTLKELFIRKVRSGESDTLMDLIDRGMKDV